MSTLRRIAAGLLPAAVAEPLRRLLRRIAVARFRAYDARHVYGGQPCVVHIADPLARGWYDHDWEVGTELMLLQERGRLRPGARVFDVGAHQGVVALMLSQRVGRDGTVVAVEAVAHNVRVARRNALQNAAHNLTVVHAAIAQVDGVLWFEDRWNGAVSRQPGSGVRVQAVTIDTLTLKYGAPDVLFIDVEGFELSALGGASKTLKAHRPDLFVEVHVGAGLERYGTAADVLSMIPAGYEVLVAPGEAGAFVPIAEGQHVMAERFRLVALAPQSSEITAHD